MGLKQAVVVVTLLILAAVPAGAQELKKLSLDDVSGISPKIEADGQLKVEGARSLKITTIWPTTVCLGEAINPDVANAQLIYSARVKSDLEGAAYLELWAHIGGGQYFSRGMNSMASGKSDWKTIQTLFIFQKGQKPDKVTLNLVINGKGTVWIDEAILTKALLK